MAGLHVASVCGVTVAVAIAGLDRGRLGGGFFVRAPGVPFLLSLGLGTHLHVVRGGMAG